MLSSASQSGSETTGVREHSAVPDPDERVTGKTVVLGLGNRYLRDDAVGILVVEELQRHELGAGVVVRAHQTFDLWLLSQFAGASGLVIVDALKSDSAPGTIAEFSVTPSPGPLSSVPGLHSLGLHDLVDFASRVGLLTCPVTIIGVEPKDCEVGEGLTPEVERVLPDVLARVKRRLEPHAPHLRDKS